MNIMILAGIVLGAVVWGSILGDIAAEHVIDHLTRNREGVTHVQPSTPPRHPHRIPRRPGPQSPRLRHIRRRSSFLLTEGGETCSDVPSTPFEVPPPESATASRADAPSPRVPVERVAPPTRRLSITG